MEVPVCADQWPLQQTLSAPGAGCRAVCARAHRGHREEQVGEGCARGLIFWPGASESGMTGSLWVLLSALLGQH